MKDGQGFLKQHAIPWLVEARSYKNLSITPVLGWGWCLILDLVSITPLVGHLRVLGKSLWIVNSTILIVLGE